VIVGDCREILPTLPEATFQCCVTSPPYWGLRDYGVEGQLGLEATPDEYVANMVAVFREVKRVLRDDGTLWLNLGDSYNNRTKVRGSSHQPSLNGFVDDEWKERARRGGVRMSMTSGGLKEKDLIGIPWRVAFALQADGWYLRSDIIWAKNVCMPDPVKDRPTRSHEYVFLLTKQARYYYDAAAIAEPVLHVGAARYARADAAPRLNSVAPKANSKKEQTETRNKRSVWHVTPKPFSGAHFAVMPEALVTPCVLAGSKLGDAVLDPFMGSGTVGKVAESLGRKWLGCELNHGYSKISAERTAQTGLPFGNGAL
jgi:DNA modification methylase